MTADREDLLHAIRRECESEDSPHVIAERIMRLVDARPAPMGEGERTEADTARDDLVRRLNSLASSALVKGDAGYSEFETYAAAAMREAALALSRTEPSKPFCDDATCHDDRERKMVVIARGGDGNPTIWCDPCIAQIVGALNDAGITTRASCCGHGFRPARITLADGRELFVARSRGDADAIEGLFLIDINGERTEPKVSLPPDREGLAATLRDLASHVLSYVHGISADALTPREVHNKLLEAALTIERTDPNAVARKELKALAQAFDERASFWAMLHSKQSGHDAELCAARCAANSEACETVSARLAALTEGEKK